MYEGIFEDVQGVKEILASHGHKSVDETLVFELLEDLKVKEQVVKVLLGSNLRRDSHFATGSPRSEGSNSSSQAEADESFYYRDSNYSSDELEIVEGVSYRALLTKPVDLTMEENHARSDSSIVGKETKTEVSVVEPVAQERDQVGAQSKNLIDFTEKVESDTGESQTKVESEVEEGKPTCVNDNSRDIFDAKSEDVDATNSATESDDVEMDYYYTTLDIDSEESVGFGESDEKVSVPPSPMMTMQDELESANFDSRNNEASNLEPVENRMDEMLEENNNDPNNNLEDIQVMEQNNALSTTVDDSLNSNKEITAGEKCVSPKPGCSKDSYYTDSDVSIVQGSDNKPSCGSSAIDNKNLSPADSNEANLSESQSSFNQIRLPIIDQKMTADFGLIRKVLPNFSDSDIWNCLIKNRNAINRLELVLWDLLPEERPQPILSAKRKQESDNNLSPIKKYVSEEFHSKANAENFPAMSEELPQAQLSSHSKACIIKPAKLNIGQEKTNVLNLSNFPSFSDYRSPTATSPAKSSNSTVKLKPSSLQFVAEKLKSVPHNSQYPKTSDAISTQNKRAITPTPDEADPVLQKQPLFTIQSLPSNSVKELETNLAKLNPQITGAIPNDRIQNVIKTEAVSNNPLANPHASSISKPRSGTLSSASIPSSSGNFVAHPHPDRLADLRLPAHTAGTKAGQKGIAEAKLPGKKLAQENSNMNRNAQISSGSFVPHPHLVRVAQWQLPARGANIKAGQKSVAVARLAGKKCAQENSNANDEDELLVNRLEQLVKATNSITNLTRHNAMRNKINRLVTEALNLEVEKHPEKAELAALNLEIEKHAEKAKRAAKAVENRFGNTRDENGAAALQIVPKIANPGVENDAAAPQMVPKIQQAAKVREKDAAPPKELFIPLINMFPDVDPTYITDLCIEAQLTKKNLESLVEILLIRGLDHPRIVNPGPEPQDVNPDTQYENLQGIFPDADPQYLREMAERYYNDPEALKDFVQSMLENHDYPTMADYLKKIKITEQIKQYTVDFKPEKFLEIFPNPFKHFEDAKRVYPYNVIALEFLKCHFRGNKIATIHKLYRSVKYHLSLAAKKLECMGPDMKSKRGDRMLPTENIPMLQEFAFLEHKAEIEEYMKQQMLKEKAEFKMLKKNNRLLECQCCFDSECMPSKCSSCSDGHIFCNSCIKLGSATKIGEGQTQFPCFVDCKGEFTLPVLQKVLEPTTFSILLRKRQEEEVKAAGLEGLVSCPFCHFASIPPPEDKVFKCLNPECMKESCRLCKELNHVPLRCDEVTKGEEARHLLEEKMTEALVRKCYKCSRPFFKDEGCNKMTCPCGASTCYICGARVKDYTHFNGQGSDRVDLCPLWSDNKVLNAQTVRVVAEAAEKEILKKNPHLKIDAKALMPTLPQSTKGPHQDIANAHVLPVHIRRM